MKRIVLLLTAVLSISAGMFLSSLQKPTEISFAQGMCGDAMCDAGETCATCTEDCGICICGDALCEGDETCDICPEDCGACGGSFCGDAVCDMDETCASCSEDCGACPPASPPPTTFVCANPTFTVSFTADDAIDLYVNGTLAGSQEDWSQAKNIVVPLLQGKNVIAAKGWDIGGVIAGILLSGDVCGTEFFSFDQEWKVTVDPPPAGWETLNFDDVSWSQATSFGQNGTTIHGSINGISTNAHWIWTQNNLGDPTIFTRFTFTVTGAVCGNATCEAGESCSTCTQDCGACPPVCGDGACNGTETCSLCTQDCGTCPPVCPDGTCNGTETCSNCVQDCGACGGPPPPTPQTPQNFCGDGICNGAESCETCVQDCRACPVPPPPEAPPPPPPPSCGDRLCSEDESCLNCSPDCGKCPFTPATPVPAMVIPPAGGAECGDGACTLSTESCATCSLDCGPCRPQCGDNRCSGGENCSSCSLDCGICSPDAFAGGCGNNVCTINENCESCMEDCGICVSLTEGLLINVRLSVQEVRDRALQLKNLLDDPANKTLKQYLSQRDLKNLQKLMDAKQLDFWTRSSVTRTVRKLSKAMEKQSQALSGDVVRLLTSDILKELSVSLDINALKKAAEAKNLEQVIRLLPKSKRSLPVLSKELETFTAEFGEEQPSLLRSLWEQTLGKVLAAEEEKGIDPTERFHTSVSLLHRMREQAKNPDAALPPLEERLEYLMNRKDALGGVVHLPSDEVEDKLEEVEKGVKSTSSHKLLSLIGIVRYIRSTANFVALEESFTQATSVMRGSFGRVTSLFTFDVSPTAEAADMLQSAGEETLLQALTGGDVSLQKDALSAFLMSQRQDLEPLLVTLDEAERTALTGELTALEEKVADAETPTDLRVILNDFRATAENIEAKARAQKNFVVRFLYRVQDFFNRT